MARGCSGQCLEINWLETDPLDIKVYDFRPPREIAWGVWGEESETTRSPLFFLVESGTLKPPLVFLGFLSQLNKWGGEGGVLPENLRATVSKSLQPVAQA